jgi:hypothetical protein
MRSFRHRHQLLVFVAFLLTGCVHEKGTEPSGRDFNVRTNGEFSIDHPRALIVLNPVGSIIIDGQGIDSTVSWFLDKWVTTKTESEADDLFPLIRIEDSVAADTLFLKIAVPDHPAVSHASLSRPIPTALPCIVRGVSGNLIVSNLQSTFVAETCRTLTLIAHTGTCIVTGTDGDVSAGVAVPDSGQCVIHIQKGNITLSIPTSTSASIRLHTGQGTLSTTGVSISGLAQNSTTLTGILGSGLATIDLETGEGSITLSGF